MFIWFIKGMLELITLKIIPKQTFCLILFSQLSKTSFPLCMQQLHSAFRSNHHLRHGGRMQYGLFLKGIGLSLEEAIRFWKSEFTKIMDGDKVRKQLLNCSLTMMLTNSINSSGQLYLGSVLICKNKKTSASFKMRTR